MPDTAASASSPAMASPATAASSPSTGASGSQATTAAMAADVNAVPAPQSGASAPAISPVTDAEVAELAARKLLIPVDGVKAAQLQDTYTQSRSNGRLHEAIDIMAPAGTPPEIVTKLNRTMDAILQDKDLRARMAEMSLDVAGGAPARVTELIKSDSARWKKVIETGKITAD